MDVSYQPEYSDYQVDPGYQADSTTVSQSYPIGSNNDETEEQYNYRSAAVSYDDYSTYQQYGGEYDYNYDYNYGYSEGQQQSYNVEAVDDGKESHSYGYYDDTGYYYDGHWYSYDANYQTNYDGSYSTEDAASNWSHQHYDAQDYDYSNDYTVTNNLTTETEYSIDQQQPAVVPVVNQQKQPPAAAARTSVPAVLPVQSQPEDSTKPQQLVDLYTKRRTMMHHGDLSSSGGSVESEQPMLRRGESNASVTTPTGPEGHSDFRGMMSESPLMMMGELDRLQTDLLTSHRRTSNSSGQELDTTNDYRAGSGSMIGPAEQADHRRGSIQSRLSQMSQQSRRERAEHFRRRRSSSICSDRDRDREHASPYNSYEDERTPVNEINLSLDMNDMTPIATQVPFPSQQQYNKSVSFEEDDDQHMYDHHGDSSAMQSTDQLHPPTTPPQDSIISAPPVPVERPCQNLTPRQKWLWAFNKICAQLMASP